MLRARLSLCFASLVGVVLLNGCLLGPNYSREPVPTPATFRFATTEVADTANTEWWKQFQDPVLDDLIATALANNKDVKIAAARVEQFMGQFVTTRSALFPQISAGATAGRQRISRAGPQPTLPGVGPVFNNFELSVSAAWEIDLFGRIRRLTEAARANLLSSEEARRATILSLVASVASSYLNLRSLDQQLAIAKATTESRAESVHVFTLRFEGGEVSQMELAQSQSEYEASLATIPQLETQIAQQEDALSVLLGDNPRPIVRGCELGAFATPVIPAGLPSDLLERRPDLLQAEQDLIAANALIGAARALYFPQISITGLFGTASGQFSSLFTGPSRVWSFAGAVTQPIFTAGNISGQVQTAEAQQRAALLSYQKAIQVAFQEVDDALIASQKLHTQLEVQGRQVTALATYARLARARYEGGYTSYIEVLDAERSLFDAQLAQTQTQAAALTSFVTLYKVMGGGWVVEADKMTTQQTAGESQSAETSKPAGTAAQALQ
ncbi:efflux transporter outer membrane subunit [Caballeronia sp. LZ062]|uniref:efflux transporter outer membrane subunit n=1 Tax=unclassified Caballeronia TaxID=2646786 RepID=UPI002857A29E|nr:MULTISPECIES: efflux transporter outer membrane subunit [unclassified Caballeronia]MDR5856814.1 efflux transporter outer membrane subunit [Caballeronia sp. LZ050]MDR5869789.1 efflux transporter outer membrane subunit [Caballeronia sp. LZ062]